MSFSWVFLVTVSFQFVLATTENSKELSVTEDHSLRTGQPRVLTCVSKNDDAALVWNYDLSAGEISDRFNNFEPVKPMTKKFPDCVVWESNECLASWIKRQGWTVVSSLKYPMAPVVDYRWEGFSEYIFNQVPGERESQNVISINSRDGTWVFSIRGTRDIEIHLCNINDLGKFSHVLIKIAVNGTHSIIEDCLDERPCDKRYDKPRHCGVKKNVSHKAAILEAFEWRTFRLQWNGNENMIKLFHDTDEKAFLQGQVKQWRFVSEISVKSDAAARFKFHNYNYFLATTENAVLHTIEFDQRYKKFCVYILVSLCPECKLNVILTKSEDGQIVARTTTSGNKDFYLKGLRTWKSVELKFSLPITPPTRIRFEVYTFLDNVNGNRNNIWWALDNIHFCEGTELSTRKSTIQLPISDPMNDRPKIKCQKLIHNKILVSDLSTSEPINFRNKNACWNLVPSQTDLTLVLSSNSKSCGNLDHSWTVHWGEKENPNRQTCVHPTCLFASRLNPFTEYNVKVVLYDGSIVLNETVKTLKPGMIRELVLKSVFADNVTGEWKPPDELIEKIRYYTVTIKRIKLHGCEYYNKETPPESEKRQNVTETTASFTGLHPYAEYVFIVDANTVEPGPLYSKKFSTEMLDIPTTNISNFRLIDEKSRLAWDGPEDCTLITGSTNLVKLMLTGVSVWAQNKTSIVNVENREYDLKNGNVTLLPFTEYKVRAYVIRNSSKAVNESNYKELNWTTAPAAPPAVEDLGPYELDMKNKTISVKWKPPYPAYGVIESYRVVMIIGNMSNKISSRIENCILSPDHVCLENLDLPANISSNIEIRVFARNVNVTMDGAGNSSSFNIYEINKKAISHPENVTIDPHNNGTVTLKWMQPSFNPTKIVGFLIKAEILQTNLTNNSSLINQTINYSVKRITKTFSTELYLLTSTKYRVSIKAVNYRNDSSNATTVFISVPPSAAFAKGHKLLVETIGTIAKLKIPGVVNATRNFQLIVLVGGLTKDLQTVTTGTDHFGKCKVAEYPLNNSEPTTFTFDVDQVYGDEKCSFLHHETYSFTVNLVFWNSSGKPETFDSLDSTTFFLPDKGLLKESSMLWLLGLSVPVICLILLFIWRMIRRNTRKRSDESHDLPLVEQISSLGSSPGMERRATHLYDAIGPSVSLKEYEPNVLPSELNFYPVVREELEEYIKEALATRLLQSHWEMLPKSYPKLCKYGKLAENKPKNQCDEIIPYDENRVILDKIGDDIYSDYINASYIQGNQKKKAYIATQGPKRDLRTKTNTVLDFWRMVWQTEVSVICMLTNAIENGEKKCEQYWPEVGERMEYNDVFVLLNIDEQVFTDYRISTLQLICQDGKREIKHFHYTEWPEHGVPKFVQSIAAFIKKLLATPLGDGPMVVHGCAGAGRTGTLILCDICLRHFNEEEVINIPIVTKGIREDRANMIDTVQQYLLAYLIIAECKILERTQISCTDLLKENIEKLRSKIPVDIHRLHGIGWQEKALHALSVEYSIPVNSMTNKVLTTFNKEKFSPAKLIQPSTSKSENDSFHALSIDGLKRKEQYLVTRQLSPSTLPNLGSLVVKKKIELIVVLQRPKSENVTKSSIMTDESGLYGYSNIQVQNQSISTNKKYFTTEKLELTDTSQDVPRVQPVTILTCIGWEGKTNEKPPPVAALVSLWMASENIKRKEGPTLIICRDGVTGCGLYLALSILLERITLEKECDVISAVRMVQRSNPNFVKSVEEFEYLYDAAINYNANFTTYVDVS